MPRIGLSGGISPLPRGLVVPCGLVVARVAVAKVVATVVVAIVVLPGGVQGSESQEAGPRLTEPPQAPATA